MRLRGVKPIIELFLDTASGLWCNGAMARRLRIQYPGAIYHVMSRGNARQDIVEDDEDRARLLRELGRASTRAGWDVLAFVAMTNHFHLMVRTPQPNLASGMQQSLSTYSQYHGRR